jgi:CBS domain-containing protein
MSCCSDVMKPIEASSCCTPQDTAAHAARAIRDSNCGCTPVVKDKESLKLVGVVTERDVCCKVAAEDRRASEVRVEAIMRPSSACCHADEPVEEARRKLHEHRATSLPVVDKAGGCCGTVSIHSLEKS